MNPDKLKWNARFAAKPCSAPQPPAFIVESLPHLQPGTVLDIASGDGAAALHLAALGHTVTAIDISEVAIERLQKFAAERQLSIVTKVVDLADPHSLQELPLFDNITISCYKPSPEQWLLLVGLLRPGGVLLITTFNTLHHGENDFPLRFCLAANELKAIHPELALDHYASVTRGNSHMDDYRFKRR